MKSLNLPVRCGLGAPLHPNFPGNQSVISKRIEAGTLQIEMDFLEQETEFRKLQTNKEIALENAEEAAASKFLKEQTFQPSRFDVLPPALPIFIVASRSPDLS